MSSRRLNSAFILILFVSLCVLGSFKVNAQRFPLSIIHINDFHARFEPTDSSGGTCDSGEECIGGYARTVYTVKKLLDEQKHNNAVYFNSGDSFQGTLWYNIGRWNVTSEFLNMLPAEAMTLGNHEFDHGVEGVVPFLETLNTTMLVANMDSSLEPTIQGKYQKSMIIERSGRKIGVIGVILETTYNLADTGKLIFTNESDAIREEAAKLRTEGANIIIVLSHCGYDVDKIIARQAGADVDVIVGAHSHTFLFTGDTTPGPHQPQGDYPTVIDHESGNRVLIVQASAYARYVGNITVFFDENGKITDWSGEPIYMSSNVPEDPNIVKALVPWKKIIDEMGSTVIGTSRVDLLSSPCSSGECNLGNFFCDAMVHAFTKIAPYSQYAWNTAPIGLVNVGALRVPLYKGNLTYSHMITMSPFENVLTAFNLTGDKLLEALEFSVEKINLAENIRRSDIFLQVSGLKIIYKFDNPVGQRVVDVKVRCAQCDIPRYEDIDKRRIYRIITVNFLVEGGDGYTMFAESATDLQEEMTDIEALIGYMEYLDPIYVGNRAVLEYLPVWAEIVETEGNKTIGYTTVDMQKQPCSSKECLLGNFYCDAMLYAVLKSTPFAEPYWSNVSAIVVPEAELKVSIEKGPITYGKIFYSAPYNSSLIAFNLSGSHLLEALEHSVADIDIEQNKMSVQTFLQVSGIKVTYKLDEAPGQRVKKVEIRCAACQLPKYEPLDVSKTYRIVAAEYTAGGAYGFRVFKDHGTHRKKYDFTDLESLYDYVQRDAPIVSELDGRIKLI